MIVSVLDTSQNPKSRSGQLLRKVWNGYVLQIDVEIERMLRLGNY